MSDPRTWQMLERHLDSIQERQDQTLEEVRGLRVEVQTTYAREVDCAARSERERNDRSEGNKRVWETVQGHETRIAKLEEGAATEAGVESVKSEAWKWLLGILAGVVGSLVIKWLVER